PSWHEKRLYCAAFPQTADADGKPVRHALRRAHPRSAAPPGGLPSLPEKKNGSSSPNSLRNEFTRPVMRSPHCEPRRQKQLRPRTDAEIALHQMGRQQPMRLRRFAQRYHLIEQRPNFPRLDQFQSPFQILARAHQRAAQLFLCEEKISDIEADLGSSHEAN